jgi:DNA polymerase-3 subunit delta'
MVGEGADLPLPWLAGPLQAALGAQQSHALLVHGPQGVGQFELAMTLAQAWLCEVVPGVPPTVPGVDPSTSDTTSSPFKPCGRCASCRLVNARTHPDLLVLLPDAVRESMGWGSASESGDAKESAAGGKASKAKPSKDIKVDAVRSAVSFAQSTSSRGRAKVVVLYPAERMNGIAAHSLLKTLEEPPGIARFVLACGAPDSLLPTVRSRCQSLYLGVPDTALAASWLAQQGVDGADVLLAAAGGAPLEALAWARDGIEAAAWLALPKRVAGGDASVLASWPLPRAVRALQALCHDALLLSAGAAPRYFPPNALPRRGQPKRLVAWSRELTQAMRHAEHPWNAGLMIEALTQEARAALAVSLSTAAGSASESAKT